MGMRMGQGNDKINEEVQVRGSEYIFLSLVDATPMQGVTLCRPVRLTRTRQGRRAALSVAAGLPGHDLRHQPCRGRHVSEASSFDNIIRTSTQPSTAPLYGFINIKSQILPTAMNDRKHSTMDSEKGDAMPIRPCRPRNRPLVTGFVVVALCYLLWSATSRYNVFHHICGTHTVTPVVVDQERALVPLEAHIMSKCPDAKVGSAVKLWTPNLTFHRTVLE
jgi:hypothetical protein